MAHESNSAEMVLDEHGQFRVHTSVFADHEIWENEQERIFQNCWVYVGHEAELKNPGDFITRNVVGRNLIFCRTDENQIQVFFNTCRHWGASVCQEPQGNRRSFQCFYHGWVYSNSGKLIGLPEQEAYENCFKKEDMGLIQPPRVSSYRGLVFMSLNSKIISLEEYLGRAKDYLDLVMDEAEYGMEIVGGEQKYGSRGNWKLLAVNSVDVYHAAPAHQTYFEYLKDIGINYADGTKLPGTALDLGNGHTVVQFEAPWGRPIAKWAPYFGDETKPLIEQKRKRLEDKYGSERARIMAETSRNLLIFPNLNVNDHVAIVIRTYQSKSPDVMEVTNWCLAPRGESADDRAMRLDNFLTFLGPGGFATPDDIEAFESCQRAFSNHEVEWIDVSKGKNRTPLSTDEFQMRVFWRQWNTLMSKPTILEN